MPLAAMDEAPAAAAAAASATAVSASTAAWPSGATASSAASSVLRRFVLNLPPGYHFLPTDAELVLHYLRPRLANQPLPLPIFIDEHILRYHPSRLVEKYREYGEDRWFFFVRRERKHDSGNRPNRATLGNGHWNATGSPRLIRSGRALIGRVRTLVFYEASRTKKKNRQEPGPPPLVEEGKANKGAKTEWTMYEYESLTPEEEESVATWADGTARMNPIVLCTIQKKKQRQEEQQQQQQSKEACKVGETKKRAINSKAKGKGQDAGGRKKRKRTAAEPQEEDHAQRTPTETEAVVQEQASTRVPDFTVDRSPAALPPPPPPPPPQETIMAAAAGGDNDNYISVHSSFAATMSSSSQFQFQAPPFAQGFLPCILAPLGGGNSCTIMSPNITWMDLQTEPPPPPPEELSTASRIFLPHSGHNAAKIAPSVHPHGFGPGLSSSSYGFAGGDTHRLSAGTGYRDLPRHSFPSQPSYGVGGGSNA